MPVLSALFLVVGGGQFIGSLAVRDARAVTTSPAPVQAATTPSKTANSHEGAGLDGIAVVQDRRADAQVRDVAAEIEADRYALTKEREKLEDERRSLNEGWRKLRGAADQRHDHLAAIYAEMPAEKAAAILVKLNPAEAATFVALMSGEDGAQILSAMPADSAVAISQQVMTRTVSARSGE